MAEKVSQAIYQALRDDSEATVGLRALLGNTTSTPYNVYHGYLPTTVDFSPASGSKGFVTYLLVSSTPDNFIGSTSGRLMQDLYNITVYHRSLTSLEAAIRRIKWRLQNKRGVTNPSTLATLDEIKLEGEQPTRYDDQFQAYWRTMLYRAWYRDDDLHGS